MRRCMRCMQEYEEHLSECPHCGYRVEDHRAQKVQYPDALDPETILMGRYILGCIHAQDGFSNVYTAWDALLEKKVFLAEYYPLGYCRLIDGRVEPEPGRQPGISVFEYGLNAFEEEAGRLIRNQDIEGIIPSFRLFRDRGTAFLVSEYVHDDTLEEILEREDSIPVQKAQKLLRGLCRTIDEMHQRGVFHWDLSCSCIFVDEEWNGRLNGFGYAKMLTAGMMKKGISLYSPYTAPELTGTDRADGQADLYALGMIGRALFQHTEELPFRKRSQIRKCLNHLTAANRKKRSHNAAELEELLSVHYNS